MCNLPGRFEQYQTALGIQPIDAATTRFVGQPFVVGQRILAAQR
jgi:hypothetical protein